MCGIEWMCGTGRGVGVRLETVPRMEGKGKGMPACASREAKLEGKKALAYQ